MISPAPAAAAVVATLVAGGDDDDDSTSDVRQWNPYLVSLVHFVKRRQRVQSLLPSLLTCILLLLVLVPSVECSIGDNLSKA